MAVIEEKKEAVVAEKAVAKKTVKKTAESKKETVIATQHSDVAYKVLIEPWITEKTHSAIAQGKYTFKVIRGAVKKEVKLAIEGMYGVKVEKVSVVNIHAKKKAYGRHMGTKQGYKKATVTLKEGDKIELFQGV